MANQFIINSSFPISLETSGYLPPYQQNQDQTRIFSIPTKIVRQQLLELSNRSQNSATHSVRDESQDININKRLAIKKNNMLDNVRILGIKYQAHIHLPERHPEGFLPQIIFGNKFPDEIYRVDSFIIEKNFFTDLELIKNSRILEISLKNGRNTILNFQNPSLNFKKGDRDDKCVIQITIPEQECKQACDMDDDKSSYLFQRGEVNNINVLDRYKRNLEVIICR